MFNLLMNNNMKKLFFVILSVITMMSFTISCDDSECKPKKDFYCTISEGYGYRIIYDRETMVMYHYAKHSGVVTPLYNADGSLRVYYGN